MSKETVNLPETRSWREIPQQVRPRAMSREGRRRLAMGVLRAATGLLVLGSVSWGAWEISSELRDPDSAPGAVKSDRIRSLVLVTDGVLDKQWLAGTLAIPGDATLMGTDLMQLRARVLADAQVKSAAVVRNFPDALVVRISERSPVARIMAQSGSDPARMMLVSRDGIAFAGTGFDPAMVATLPWLDGVALTRQGPGFAPIGGMEAVAELLASAKLEAEGLYRTWQVVSIARLATDGNIEVRTRDGMKVIFGTGEDYLRQIARLDLLIDDYASDPTRPLRQVNLSLGPQVPVSFGTADPTLDAPAVPPAQQLPAAATASAAGPLITFPAFSNLQIDAHRGL
jgi:cell division septal protein FtsQ